MKTRQISVYGLPLTVHIRILRLPIARDATEVLSVRQQMENLLNEDTGELNLLAAANIFIGDNIGL